MSDAGEKKGCEGKAAAGSGQKVTKMMKNVKELKGILCMVRTIVSCSRVKMFKGRINKMLRAKGSSSSDEKVVEGCADPQFCAW